MSLVLSEAGPAFGRYLVDNEILHDDDRNWRWGFGRGDEGTLKATECFLGLLRSSDPSVAARIVWSGDEVAALMAFRYLPEERRSVRLLPYFFDLDLGVEVLEMVTAMLFGLDRSTIHRVETELVTRAKAERFMFKSVGYRQEGKLREALWMGTNSLDTLLFGITRPEYLRKRKAA